MEENREAADAGREASGPVPPLRLPIWPSSEEEEEVEEEEEEEEVVEEEEESPPPKDAGAGRTATINGVGGKEKRGSARMVTGRCQRWVSSLAVRQPSSRVPVSPLSPPPRPPTTRLRLTRPPVVAEAIGRRVEEGGRGCRNPLCEGRLGTGVRTNVRAASEARGRRERGYGAKDSRVVRRANVGKRGE